MRYKRLRCRANTLDTAIFCETKPKHCPCYEFLFSSRCGQLVIINPPSSGSGGVNDFCPEKFTESL